MQTKDLYPELTADEVELIIGPLTVADASTETVDAEGAFTAIRPLDLPLDAFGPDSERYSFDRVSRHVAETFLQRYWDPRDDEALHDPTEFMAAVCGVLSEDVLELAIRPLADCVRPVPEIDDALAYRHFCRDLLADGLAAFAREFPVMWQRLGIRLRQRVYAVGEAVRRLHSDREALSDEFGLAPETRIVTLSLAGDTHGGGRNVSVVELADGSKVIYKPRPVDCEAAYHELVDYLNAEFGCDFNAARVLPRGEYGYVEFVETDTGADLDVYREGQLSAVLYAINARDMHFTNILPTAYGPVPVDLETLLHPHRQKSVGTVETDDSGYKRLATSVFGTGVLPVIVTHQDRDGYIDVGYLGGGEVRGSGPFRRFRIEHPFSARIRVSWAPDEAPSMEPDAALDSASAAVRRSCSQMVAGFSETYRLIKSRSREFVGAVERLFGQAEIRYIHNATVQYVQCMRMLTGTAVSADHDLAQGLVKRIGIASRGGDTKLVDSECRQLWETDVPYFLVRADRREVTDGSTQRRAVGPLDRSPLDQFRAKMDELSESDLIAQVRLIRIAFNAKLPDPHAMTPAAEVLSSHTSRRSSDDECRELAARVGDELIADLVQDRYAHLPQTWIGPVATAVANRPWPPGVLGYDLYTGRVGPALTLAGLARVLGEPRFAEASMRVFGPAARILAEGSYEARSIAHAGNGAYSGFPGALWALASAGRLLDRRDLMLTARQALSFLQPSDAGADDAWFDTVSGDMGATLVSLALGEDAAVSAATQACERALDSGLVGRAEYSGLGHGLAGILHFASRTHLAAADRASATLARDIVAEFTSAFRSSTGGLRTNRTGEENHSDSWCNGTAGVLVGMNAAVSAGLLDPDVVRSTVKGISDSSIATSCTLCHGALGLYDVLGQVHESTAGAAYDLRERLEAYLTVDRLREFLDSPDSRYSQGPCLMVGRAGVAWHLLTRITDEPIPSPLALGRVNIDA